MSSAIKKIPLSVSPSPTLNTLNILLDRRRWSKTLKSYFLINTSNIEIVTQVAHPASTGERKWKSLKLKAKASNMSSPELGKVVYANRHIMAATRPHGGGFQLRREAWKNWFMETKPAGSLSTLSRCGKGSRFIDFSAQNQRSGSPAFVGR